MQGIDLREWMYVCHRVSTGICLHVSLMGFNQPLQIGKNGELWKWGRSKRMAFRRRKSYFFLRAPKLGNGKSPLSFFHCHLHTLKIGKKIGSEKDGAKPPPDWVRWVNAAGCRSHYQQGLVVGKAVREPEYCFQGRIHTVQNVKVPEQSQRNYRKSFPPHTVSF